MEGESVYLGGEAEEDNVSLMLFSCASSMWLHVAQPVFPTQMCETNTVSGELSYDAGEYNFPRMQK